MRDLAVLHLANKAEIEEVKNLGSLTEYKSFPVANVVTYDLDTNVAPDSIKVTKDEVPLRLYTGKDVSPPIGTFKYIAGSSEIPDKILVAYPPQDTGIEISYSLAEDWEFVEFELAGSGMQYASLVYVGGEPAYSVFPLTDRKLRFKVPRSLEKSVVIANLKAVVPLDNSPFSATEILFDIATRSSFASGNRVLLQRFLTILMAPDGADLYNVLPRSLTLNPQGRSVIVNRLKLAVSVASTRTIRSTPRNASPEEVLVSAFVEDIDIDDNNGTVDATVRMQTMAGSSFVAPLTLGA